MIAVQFIQLNYCSLNIIECFSIRSKDSDHNTQSDVESSPIPSTQAGHFKRRSEWDDHAHNFDEYISQPEMDHRHLHQFEMVCLCIFLHLILFN
jgi:hypothetical protein